MRSVNTTFKLSDSSGNHFKNQIPFPFNSFTKKEWMKESINAESNLYSLIKQPVKELFYSNKGYLKYLSFDDVYKLAAEIMISQVKKSIKKNKKCFFENKFNDNYIAYTKIMQRLTNNLKNLFDPRRKINLLNIDYWLINDVYINHEEDTTIWDIQKLVKTDPQLIIENIMKLVKDFEITESEAIELGLKIGMNFSYLFKEELNIQYNNLQKDANNQTYLIFNIDDEKEVA